MNTQINIGVIEAISIGAHEVVATSGGVLVFDVGGGGGAVPLVAEAAHSEVDEPVEEVIGSIVGGSTAEATGGGASGGEGLCMHDSDTILNDCVWDTIIQAQEQTVRQHVETVGFIGKLFWVINGNHRLNQFVFQAHTLVHDIEHLQFIGMLSLEEVQTLYNRETYDAGRNGLIALLRFVLAFELVKHQRNSFITSPRIRMEKVMKEKVYISQSIAAGGEMLQVWDEKFLSSTHTGNGWLPCGGTSLAKFKNQPEQPFLARHMVYRYLKYCPSAPVYTTGVLQKLLTRGKKLGMYEPEFYCPYVVESSHQSSRQTKTFFPSLPTATDDYLEELSSAAMHKQLLDATSQELYMLDRWIHDLGQLTPYGKIDFIFFDLPNGMAPHISQALKVASSFMTYEGVVVMILPCSVMWEGLLAHLADNNDGFVEFLSGCLLSSMAVDTKGTSGQKFIPGTTMLYATLGTGTKRLVRVEPIIYMSLWNTLNT
ncbi:hypothetical protein SELMODRAFT_428301 [Selaginella moellendorffii]|uniref:Uncharacterized protein n=1 Tax=Selaginella moellendorffii TaxID=88036 RepID=D8T2E0_SELML|nr:hypothetical protein SELMODRAFT_428301 [Selaginella moellendorffii]